MQNNFWKLFALLFFITCTTPPLLSYAMEDDDGPVDMDTSDDDDVGTSDDQKQESNSGMNWDGTSDNDKPTEKKEVCYGIADNYQNDNVFVMDGRRYFRGQAPACHPLGSVTLPAGNPHECENIMVGISEKGERITGSLKPDPNRAMPSPCYPYDLMKQEITFMNPDFARPSS